MVSVEESSHSIEQVFVSVQIFLFLNQLKFELSTDRLVLKRMIVLDVVDELLEEITRIVRLQEIVVHVLRRNTHMLVILCIKLVAKWSLHFLIEIKHFDNVCFLALS